jgi:hypothetical protein
MINNYLFWSFVVSTVLPLLVGLVTREVTHAGLKAVLLALLTAATGLGSAWLASNDAGIPFDWETGIITWIQNFIVAVAAHFGLWKPTGVTDKAQASLVK